MRKPIIGITPSPTDDEHHKGEITRYALARTYSEAVEAAGGIPVILPHQQGNVDQILEILDGLLLSGGGDLRPEVYGDTEYHPATYGIYDLRDQFELELVRKAVARDLPVLAICRGIQVLNVAMGGTLIQDIADQHSDQIAHRQGSIGVPAAEPSHRVTAEPGSLLARVYGATSLQTNSFHHQALREIGHNLRPIATAPDGIVESVEHTGCRWVLGVQWHPEMMFRAHDEHLKPFQALVEAASVAQPAEAGIAD